MAAIAQPLPRSRGSWIVRVLVALAIYAGALVVGNWAYQNFLFEEPAPPTSIDTPVTRTTIDSTVIAAGAVATQQEANIGFRSNGIVEFVSAAVGQEVAEGDILAKLGTTDLEYALRNAEINLTTAEARLDALFDGPADADLQSAQASVISAQSSLQRAALDRETLTAGPSEDELIGLKASMQQARSDLIQAQSNYDKVSWKPDIGIQPEATALEKATIAYQRAEADFNLKVQPPSAAEVNVSNSNVQNARAQLATSAARLAQLDEGPSALDLQTAQASVDSATISVEQARNNLEQATLRAPFDGIIAAVQARPDEATSGAVFSIVSLDELKVEVSVDEASVAGLRPGLSVEVTFDALPDVELQGVVASIAPAAVVQQGVSAFPVTVELPGAEDVRIGMNATVTILVERKENVLAVPNRAIRTVRGLQIVEVRTGEGTEIRPVETGIRNDEFTEIVSGLSASDVVVMSAGSTSAGGGFGGGFGGGGFGGGGFRVRTK